METMKISTCRSEPNLGVKRKLGEVYFLTYISLVFSYILITWMVACWYLYIHIWFMFVSFTQNQETKKYFSFCRFVLLGLLLPSLVFFLIFSLIVVVYYVSCAICIQKKKHSVLLWLVILLFRSSLRKRCKYFPILFASSLEVLFERLFETFRVSLIQRIFIGFLKD